MVKFCFSVLINIFSIFMPPRVRVVWGFYWSTFKNGIHTCFFKIYIWLRNGSLKITSNFEFQRIRKGKKMFLIGIFNLFIVLLLGLIFKTFCYYQSNSLQKKTNI